MIYLVFAACLDMAPDNCTTRMVPTFHNSAVSCRNTAEGTLALWALKHPEWRVVEWACAKERPGYELPGEGAPNA